MATVELKRATRSLEKALQAAEFLLRFQPNPVGSAEIMDMVAVRISVEAAIRRIAPDDSVYREQMGDGKAMNELDRCKYAIANAKALLADIGEGAFVTVTSIIRAEQISSYLDSAEQLLSKGQKSGAALIAQASLESHLRNLAEKNDITIFSRGGDLKEAPRLNDELAAAAVYNKTDRNVINGWFEMHDYAGHGSKERLKKAYVELMIKWIRTFLFANPA